MCITKCTNRSTLITFTWTTAQRNICISKLDKKGNKFLLFASTKIYTKHHHRYENCVYSQHTHRIDGPHNWLCTHIDRLHSRKYDSSRRYYHNGMVHILWLDCRNIRIYIVHIASLRCFLCRLKTIERQWGKRVKGVGIWRNVGVFEIKYRNVETYWHMMHLPVIGSHGPPLHGHFWHFEFNLVGIP